jgi:hypothetical protein
MRVLVHTVAAVVTAVVVLSTPPAPAASAPQVHSRPTLRTLGGIEDVRAAFNKDRGKLRILLLLSPT